MSSRSHAALAICAAAILGAMSVVFASSAAGRGSDEVSEVAAKAMLENPENRTPEKVFEAVSGIASTMASQPYRQARTDMPKPFRDLRYDTYRKLRPAPEQALWRSEQGEFSMLPLPRGGLFTDPVEIYIVDGGEIQALPNPERFVDFTDYPNASAADRRELGVSGWRALGPFRNAEKADEAAVFQGGAYFRAIGRGLAYGVSARALAIGTASRNGEEFPRLTHFWIFKPGPYDTELVAAALLDAPSATGAYLFTIHPGARTTIEVKAVIHPRREITEVGVAAMSSMFLHGPADRVGVDDYRPEVHDSDGLEVMTGSGERIWRPLVNPKYLQVSMFQDTHPRGFGLVQRERKFPAYADLEARYDERTSVWVEPQGDWGKGHVGLVEIPTGTEYNDNIVAFWRPERPWAPGVPQELSYRLTWDAAGPTDSPLAKVVATRTGAHPESGGKRRFVIDYAGAPISAASTPDVWSSAGEITNIHLVDDPADAGAGDGGQNKDAAGGGKRLVFDLDPKGASLIELRAALAADGVQQAETWLFRWTPD